MYSPNSLLPESVTSGDSSQAPGLASQALGLAPQALGLPSQALGLASWVELPEVLDVPGVLDRCLLLRLKAHGARPGDVDDPERALPHG